MTNLPIMLSPHLCEKEARAVKTALESVVIQPICLDTFNDVRECLFKTDSSFYYCKTVLAQLRHCVKDPVGFKDFLQHSTPLQRKSRDWDSYNYRAQMQYL